MSDTFEVACPCCNNTLIIDAASRVVLTHREAPKKPLIEDLAAAVNQLKGDAERRSEIFSKSFDDHLKGASLRERKFEELLKQAKEKPDERPERAFDFD
jgi:hypothetical protein